MNKSDRRSRTGRTGQGMGVRAAIAAIALTGVVVLSSITGNAAAAGALLGLVAVLYILRAVVFTWNTVLMLVVAVLMLIPFNRFTLPLALPIGIQPLVGVTLIAAGTLCVAFLVDPSFEWRRTPLIGAVAGFFATQALSVIINIRNLAESGLMGNVVREVLQNAVLVLVLFVVVRQLLRSRRTVDLLVMVVAALGAVIGAMALVEQAIGFNFFYTLGSFVPLNGPDTISDYSRDGSARAVGPTAHPIELGVMLTLVLPLSIYLAVHAGWPRKPLTRSIVWGAAAVAILAGVLASVSRTSIVMIIVMMIVAIILVPRLLLPIAGAAAVAVTGLLVFVPSILAGTLGSLLDVDSLIESQTGAPGLPGSGRLNDIDGSLERISENPYFGTGLGSRIVVGALRNSTILDNQVLTTAEQSGIVGVIGLLALIAIPTVRLALLVSRSGAPARYRHLGVALTTIVASFACALILFDGLGFKQASGMFVLVLAIASWLLAEFPIDQNVRAGYRGRNQPAETTFVRRTEVSI